MPNYTSGSTRVALAQADFAAAQANGSVVLDSRRVRPYWFDGRFLDARDLEREQNYFLQREADLGQASGFQTVTGLMVDQTSASGKFVGSGSFVIHAGEGVTPAGEMVSVPEDLTVSLASLVEQATLDVQFGLSIAPKAAAPKRSGLYVIGLQPMEHTANPITAYPTTLQGPRTLHDGDIVEATVVSLVPYPNPAANFAASLQQAALARQIFVTGSPSVLSDSLLPLALVSVQGGAISWIDPYLVRRDSGQQYSGVRFGLGDPEAQEAYLLQYDMQLQSIIATRQASGLKANFAASDFLQSIPSGGRFPMDAIDTSDFSQVFFPQEMDVRLSIVPSDELPALLEDSLALPPIDLTLPSSAYAAMAVLALIPVPRAQFASLQSALPETSLVPTLPQVLANRRPLQLLRLFQGAVNLTPVPAVANNAWATAIGSQTYGFYLRRPSDPTLERFTDPTGVMLSSSANPSAFGQTVTFTAGISPGTATGSVQFLDGAAALGTAPISVGAASLAVPNLAVGSHPMTASYAGDAGDSAGTSSVLTQVVNRATGSVAVSSSANPSAVGQAVTFTAKVVPAGATGTVQFLDGATVLGTGSLSAGAATLTTSTLALGTHAITAVYSGDGNNAGATSAVFTQTVSTVTTSVTLSSSANPSAVGQPVTFTARITPSGATGTVQFLDGGAALGTGAVSAGTATLAVSTLSAGAHSITAVYSGDGNNAASTSAVLTQTVQPAASSVAISSSLNPSTLGQAVTLTAKLTPPAAVGSVQFLDGAAALGTATLSSGAAAMTVTTLAVGTHSITAGYSGDANDAPSTSPVLTQTVGKAASALTLSSSANPSTLGQSVTFTAKVTPATATGPVQFLDGAAVLGTGTLTGGTATFADATLAVGAHSMTAAYGGDASNAASTSAVLTQTVNKAGVGVALSSSANPSSLGQPVTFTAKLTPATAAGAVQFLDGAAVLGTGTSSAGTATFATGTLAVGAHSITAAYGGDANDAAATSPVLAQTVNRAGSSVALNSSANPSTAGQSVTFTAKVTPASATGTVQFLDDATVLGSGALSAGTATFADAALAVGSHTLTAVYAGDGNDADSTSPPLVQTVSKTATTVVLSSSANPSAPGQAVVFTARVTPTSATGTVQFLDGTAAIGTGTLNGGVTTVTDAALAVGSHNLTAIYAGDGNNAESTSAVLTQTVSKTATSVALSSSQNPSVPGQAVTFTAKVTPATATGSVQFLDGTTALGTGTLSAGTASFTDAALAVGSHTLTAVYAGDGNNAGSTSAALTQTVSKAVTSVALSSSVNPSAPGQAVVFTARVTPATATGTVQFLDGTAVIGTGILNGGVTTVTDAALAVGSHTLKAVYSGDGNNAGSTSTPLAQTVNKAGATMTLASSANPSILTQALTFTAKIIPPTATGNVTFADETTSLGTAALAGGQAQVQVFGELASGAPTLPQGNHTITATYAGDATTGGASAQLTQTVNVQIIQ